MSISVVRPGASNERLPAYLTDNLPALQEFSKKLDEVSDEIRTTEAKLQSCGICLKFVRATVNHGGWIRNKGQQDEFHFRKVSILGWIEVKEKYRLVFGEAEQACDLLPDGTTKPRTGVDDFELIDWKPLIETKAQVRLVNVDYLPDFVKALSTHVASMTTRWSEFWGSPYTE